MIAGMLFSSSRDRISPVSYPPTIDHGTQGQNTEKLVAQGLTGWSSSPAGGPRSGGHLFIAGARCRDRVLAQPQLIVRLHDREEQQGT
jgi:hypothetical protein